MTPPKKSKKKANKKTNKKSKKKTQKKSKPERTSVFSVLGESTSLTRINLRDVQDPHNTPVVRPPRRGKESLEVRRVDSH